MPPGPPASGLLCVLVIGVAIGTVIAAVVLDLAVVLSNLMLGSPQCIPVPSFAKALQITFINLFANVIITFLISKAAAAGAGIGNAENLVVTQLISVPVSLVIMAGLLSEFLPTTLGRAILVIVCYILILFMMGILLGIVVVGSAALR
jgi:hypothetical protein